MFSISAMSLLVRMVPASSRGRALGFWQGGFLLGGITGPVVGGVVTGISIRLPFFLYAGTLIAAGAVAMIALRHTPLAERSDTKTASHTSLRTALRDRAYRAALAANFADAWGAVGVRSALIPLFVGDVLHEPVLWTGLGFLVVSAVNVATLLPAARYADRVGRKPVLLTGCLISATAMATLAAWPEVAGYFVGLALLGLGSGMLDVAPGAVVGDVVEGRGGPVFAAYSMSADIGLVVGPIVAGRIADVSYTDAFALTSVILVLAAVVAARAPETLTRARPSEQATEAALSPRLDDGTSARTPT
jgi:MFS family permease